MAYKDLDLINLILGNISVKIKGLELPLTETIIGSFTIKETDLEDCNLSPWLACVIIKKEYRGKGYGKQLLNFIKAEIEQNYPQIYLFTSHIGFYEKIGFEYIKDVMHSGEVNRLYVKKSSN